MRLSIVALLMVAAFSVNSGICQEIAPDLKDNTFAMAFIRPETQYLGKWQRLIYTEVFRRLGIKVEFRLYSPKRASIEADAGSVDGEASRIAEYAAAHPELIRVEEVLFTSNYSAFTAKDSIPQMKGWESFKGTNYRVAYRMGIRLCEKNLSKFVSRENLSEIVEPPSALKQLIADRTDVFVDEESTILTLVQTPEFKYGKIRLVGVMESIANYPYVHKKHASLTPQMAEIIKAMKAEGLIEQYRMTVEKEFGIVRK
ncbi:MAG: transporter substrate-binding domain-containing protein [Desulfobacteraceae bacterium]|nr:transporter substrate-binding domain-containing protein [Desulfobacteraceae bacterium]